MHKRITYLIRHASALYPPDEDGRLRIYGPTTGLTVMGRMEAAHLAARMLQRDGGPFDALITSPYERAVQTAEILAEKLGVPAIATDERLRDTASSWEGVPRGEFMTIFHEGNTFNDPRTEETLEELAERMVQAYESISQQFEGQRVGIVSHGDPLRALYFRLLYKEKEFPPYKELVDLISLDPAEGIRLGINQTGGIESERVGSESEGRVRKER